MYTDANRTYATYPVFFKPVLIISPISWWSARVLWTPAPRLHFIYDRFEFRRRDRRFSQAQESLQDFLPLERSRGRPS